MQSHMDMVPAKTQASGHDFTSDPITLLRRGDWVTADGTTLGADNGMGMAVALAVLEEQEREGGPALPPVEALFTAGAALLHAALGDPRTSRRLLAVTVCAVSWLHSV
jgi:dipeptidase D